jgi:hypothetical protein
MNVEPSVLAVGMLRNEMAGLGKVFENLFRNVDTELTIRKRTFGREMNKRTWDSYKDFCLDLIERINQSITALNTIFRSFNNFLHSNPPQPVDSRILRSQLNDLVNHLLEILKDLKHSSPPEECIKIHEKYQEIVHKYLVNFGSFLQQLEEELERGWTKGVVFEYTIDTNEISLAIESARPEIYQAWIDSDETD